MSNQRVDDGAFIKVSWPLVIVGIIIPVVAGYFLAALISTDGTKTTLGSMIEKFNVISANPTDLIFNKYTLPLILICIVAYFLIVIVIGCSNKPTRYGEEQGSSHLISPFIVNKELADFNNSIADEHNIVVYRQEQIGWLRKCIAKFKFRNAD